MNLDVVKVDAELGLIAVRGAIPGPKGGIVFVQQHRQDSRGEEGPRRRHQQQPAEGFRPCQSRRRPPPATSKERRDVNHA